MAVTIMNATEKAKAYKMCCEGKTLTEVGNYFGVSRKTIRRVIDEMIEKPVEKNPIEVGDFVVTTKDFWYGEGISATIVGVDPDDTDLPYRIEYEFDSANEVSWVASEDIILVAKVSTPEEIIEEVVATPVENVPATSIEQLTAGTRVAIREDSEFFKSSFNPSKVEEGTVVNREVLQGWVAVDWDSGISNSYKPEDLDLVVAQVEEVVVDDNLLYTFVAPQDSITIMCVDQSTGQVEQRNINKHNSAFQQIRDMLKADQSEKTVRECFILLDPKAIIESFSVGRVKVDMEAESVVFIKSDGTERKVPSDLAGDIVNTVKQYGKTESEKLAKFLDKLMDNPSFSAIEGLYRFMKHNCIEINQDGSITAWKGVRGDLWSQRGGSLKTTETITVNESGQVYNGDFDKEIRVDRSEVDDNPDNTCSHGLHVGNKEYASSWSEKLLKVRLEPQDVVAVPKDYDGAKMRCCAYTPICVA